jgi:predicted dinucleotide-binding enzyme
MRVAVLGTGPVGRSIAGRLVELGHEVTLGSRSEQNEAAVAWAGAAGDRASHGTFAQAAAAAETVFNCTGGGVALDALRAAGAEHLAGKVLADVSNPLDFSQGLPPVLGICNTTSVAERIQQEFPQALVVKTLNTVNHLVMVDPARLPGAHVMFLCGNDAGARDTVRGLLESFGWQRDCILDLGDVTAARGMEMYVPLWLRLMGALESTDFNIAVVRGSG